MLLGLKAARSAAAEWIRTLPDGEKVIWHSAGALAQDQALRRLEGLMMRRAGASTADAAAHAQLTPGRFYQIARAWQEREHLSILGVGIQADGAAVFKRRPRSVENKALALCLMREIRDSNPDWKTTEVVAGTAERLQGDVSTRTIVRWWNELRQEEAGGQFGARLALDFCTVAARRSDGRLHAIATICDRETRTLLGASLLPNSAESSFFRIVAGKALHGLTPPSSRTSSQTASLRRLSVALGANAEQNLRLLADLDLPGRKLNQVGNTRHFGRPTSETLGGALGPLRLRPGGFERYLAAMGTEADPTMDEALVSGLIEEIMDKQRSRLRELAVEQRGGTEGVREVLSRIASA